MLCNLLLAAALLLPGLLPAAQPPAKPCTDVVSSDLPSCGIAKDKKKEAHRHFALAMKLARRKQWEKSLAELRLALDVSPTDLTITNAETALKQQMASESLRRGNQAMLSGNATEALSDFKRASDFDPSDAYATQRLRDAMPTPEAFNNFGIESGEVHLQPRAGKQNFEFKGNATEFVQQFARAFGITATEQGPMPRRQIRLRLDQVDWETGSQILARMCKLLILPTGEHSVMIADDTEENRRNLTHLMLRSFTVHGLGSTQELTDLSTALRILFDLRFITTNPAQGCIVIRAPQPTMEAVARFMDAMDSDPPTVVLEVKVFEVSSNLSKDLGITAPDSFSVFNLESEARSLLNSSSYQEIVSALKAAGQPVNANTILGALLATGNAGVLSQPFATIGGGIVESGVTIPTTSAHFSAAHSEAHTLDQMLLRAGDGKAATMKIGSRYPIVTTSYAATNAATNVLSQLGLSSYNSSVTTGTTTPSPQFNYEDIGLVMKATPHVHGKLISLDYELMLRGLGATQSNGLPLLTNREVKGTISTNDGEGVVIAGLVSKTESKSLNGFPLLSAIPILGQAFMVSTPENNSDELLIVVTPHLALGRSETSNAWLPVPTNVPK